MRDNKNQSPPYFLKSLLKWAYRVKRAQREVFLTLKSKPQPGDSAEINLKNKSYLLTSDGIIPEIIKWDPYFAGWSSVLACVNDIYAGGGVPLFLLNTISAKSRAELRKILKGIEDMARIHNIEISGGHASLGKNHSVSVFMLGEVLNRERFKPREGNTFFILSDLRNGLWRTSPYPFYNSFFRLSVKDIRQRYEVLRKVLKNSKTIFKDVSGGGILSATLSFLEENNCGLSMDLEKIPVPEGVPVDFWLRCFPSFSFIGATDSSSFKVISKICSEKKITLAEIGVITEKKELRVKFKGREYVVYARERRKGFIYV